MGIPRTCTCTGTCTCTTCSRSTCRSLRMFSLFSIRKVAAHNLFDLAVARDRTDRSLPFLFSRRVDYEEAGLESNRRNDRTLEGLRRVRVELDSIDSLHFLWFYLYSTIICSD